MSSALDLTYLGMVEIDGKTKSFGILDEDRRRHMYIMGKSGVGKSTLIENLVLQDIYAGKGVCFIDPLGDSAESIIDRIPNYRTEDVIYFNPADTGYPLALNMLEKTDEEEKFLIIDNLMEVMNRLWEGAWSARMEYILRNTISALLDVEGNSLMGVLKMFNDKQFRKYIAEHTENLVVRDFWQSEFPSFSDSYKNEALAAIQNKVGQFFANDMMRNILGQHKGTLNFREIMDGQKILIANLSKGRLGGENSSFLGSMLVTKLQLAAMSRVDQPEEERKDFYLYVDEFQNLITPSFATILSEARKYRLNLTIAHQYLGQLEEVEKDQIRKAIFGNVGTMIVFQVSSEDAETFATEFNMKDGREVKSDIFTGLDRGQVIVKLFVQSKTMEPFFGVTLKPLYEEFRGSKQMIIQSSRQKYARKREEVEPDINDYYEQGIVWNEDRTWYTRLRAPKRKKKDKGSAEADSNSQEQDS
jgi:type IV secretory pathway VirB4 component